MGRYDSQKFIEDGLILLNYKECKNIKQTVFENDVVSIRKNGKYIILNTEKKTKKDNILLNVKKYN
jgi:RNA-binding protein YlmH